MTARITAAVSAVPPPTASVVPKVDRIPSSFVPRAGGPRRPGRPHAVESVCFSEGSLVCRCGWQAPSGPPAELETAWKAHRVSVGLPAAPGWRK